jgi:hypothetical protein
MQLLDWGTILESNELILTQTAKDPKNTPRPTGIIESFSTSLYQGPKNQNPGSSEQSEGMRMQLVIEYENKDLTSGQSCNTDFL